MKENFESVLKDALSYSRVSKGTLSPNIQGAFCKILLFQELLITSKKLFMEDVKRYTLHVTHFTCSMSNFFNVVMGNSWNKRTLQKPWHNDRSLV